MAGEAWQPTAALLAMLYNVNRDPKKADPARPSDFDRYAPPRPRKSGEDLGPVSIRDLKSLFCRAPSSSAPPQPAAGPAQPVLGRAGVPTVAERLAPIVVGRQP